VRLYSTQLDPLAHTHRRLPRVTCAAGDKPLSLVPGWTPSEAPALLRVCTLLVRFILPSVINRTTRFVGLNSYANGTALSESHFSLQSKTLPPLADGEVLLQTLELSPDPYMRGRMTGVENFFLPQFQLRAPLAGFGVARILESRNPAYQPGQIVHGSIEWAELSKWGADAQLAAGLGSLEILDPQLKPHRRALDVLGITGLTAYFGALEVAQPRRGESMLISGAAGSIGSIVGQIAKICGARVIGLAGSDRKCAVLKEQLRFDAALNYRSASLEQQLRELMPTGPDVYFDNVGGALTQTVMKQMQRPARVIECGQISTYDEQGGGWNLDIRPIHGNGLRWEGFTPLQFLEFFPGALAQLSHWLRTGKVIALETVIDGFENAPRSLAGLFRGENIGKMLLHVAE
jgi:NADPH-dependent curcumin reductase CurA